MLRAEKIKLLKDLQEGKIKVKDLRPKMLVFRVGCEGTSFTMNGETVSLENHISELRKLPRPIRIKVRLIS